MDSDSSGVPCDTCRIALTHGKFALIDTSDAEYVGTVGRWHAMRTRNTWYAGASAITDSGRKTLYMHRMILEVPAGLEVDHINRDGLDNRRSNLRQATHQQNIVNSRLAANNTSGYRGVVKDERNDHWVAQIRIDGRHERIGNFVDTVTAAYAYDLRALDVFGPFANLNILDPFEDLSRIRTLVQHGKLVPPRGEDHFYAKLTEADVTRIRMLYASGRATVMELARTFGVTHGTIRPVLQRKTWKNVA